MNDVIGVEEVASAPPLVSKGSAVKPRQRYDVEAMMELDEITDD